MDHGLAVNTTILIDYSLLATFLLPVQSFFADITINGYCKPNAFMEGGDSYMGENQIFVMAYLSTARIPPGNAETIRAPNRKIPVRCYSLFEIVV